MDNRKLASRLKELRKINHFNQEYVASYLDISRQAYSHYETGRNIPPPETLVKLAQLYHLPVEEFLTLSTPMLSTICSVPQDFDYLDDFLDFFNSPNSQIYHALNKNEKLLIYFYHELPIEDQEDLLEFLKIRTRRSKEKEH